MPGRLNIVARSRTVTGDGLNVRAPRVVKARNHCDSSIIGRVAERLKYMDPLISVQ